MILNLTDGTTTINLQGSTAYISGCTYFPATAQPGDDSVTDRADLILRGTTAQIRSAIRAIEMLLDTARRRRATRLGARVWRYYAPLDTDIAWRSEIYDGRIVWSDNPALRRLQDGATDIITVTVALIFERAPFEEGPETELALTSSTQAIAVTGGAPIANDPDNVNWVGIAAAAVTGNLPSPLRLQFINNDGANRSYANFYIGVNAFGGPGWAQVLQGENALSGGTPTASANTSGGAYLAVTLAANSTATVQWRLPAAMLAASGHYFRLLANIYASSNCWVTPIVREYYGFVELWRGQEVALNSAYSLHDLGAIPIPPGGDAGDAASVVLELQLRADGNGFASIDYVALLGTDAYRRLNMPGMATAHGDYIEVDEIEQRYSQVEAGIGRHPILTPLEQPLRIWPNVAQRIHILVDTQTGAAPITYTGIVRCWHRPRRATV